MSKYSVYKVTCQVTGMSRIGIEKGKGGKRFQQDLYLARTSPTSYFHWDLFRFGAERFDWAVLAVCDNRRDADRLERYFIAKFRTEYPGGYNLTDGGGRGTRMSPAVKIRMLHDRVLKGKGYSPDQILRDRLREHLAMVEARLLKAVHLNSTLRGDLDDASDPA